MLTGVETWIKESPLLVMFFAKQWHYSWSSKKQSCIALSTIEAEFIACSITVQEVVWIKRIMEHLGVIGRPMDRP